jgi:hypothetical protein
VSQLTEHRREKDSYFHHDPHSPLTEDQRLDFEGLKYFPENDALRFDLPIQEFDEKEQIQMQTSTGSLQEYTRLGKIEFKVEGDTVALTVYQSRHGFFIPFVDSQAGETTYGAGRYLDPHLESNGTLRVDFNLAYNPYCAYNELYSCPIPPAENRLSIAIKAGEKNYK